MKFSAILVSVNLAASLPIAAQAAEEATSDRAAWIEQAISGVGKTPGHRLSLSEPINSAPKTAIKLRPFVPNRYLPTQRELELAAAQRAQANSSFSNRVSAQALMPKRLLSGQVTAYAAQQAAAGIDPQNAANQVATQGAPPAVLGRTRSLPQLRANNNTYDPLAPIVPEPADESVGQMRTAMRSAQELLQARMKEMQQTLSKSPSLDPAIGRLPAKIGNDVIAGNAAPDLYPVLEQGSAGPPPFPLSLLPEKSLKQLIGSMRGPQPHGSGTASDFGAWHQPNRSNLAYGGFQSHIKGAASAPAGFRSYSHSDYQSWAGLAPRRRNYAARCLQRGRTTYSNATAQPQVRMYAAYQHSPLMY